MNRLLQDYDFDGVDLAWQFPPVKVKKNRGTFGSLWHGLKKTFGYGKFKDEKEQEHRDGFTIMVRDLKTQLRAKNKALTLTVLPHINSSSEHFHSLILTSPFLMKFLIITIQNNISVYYDARQVVPNLEAVHIFAFDQSNPERNPKKADYPAPIYESYGREITDNVDSQTR